MSFRVSIRDVDELERRLKAGHPFEIPRECRRNSDVVYRILEETHRVLPEYANLTPEEKTMIADSVAYLLRPDIVRAASLYLGPAPVAHEHHQIPSYNPDQPVHLRNDPAELHPRWTIPKDLDTPGVGGEFCRAYSCPLAWIPGLRQKLDPQMGNSLALAIMFAEITVFLLTPEDLTPYNYAPGEKEAFNATLQRQMREV